MMRSLSAEQLKRESSIDSKFETCLQSGGGMDFNIYATRKTVAQGMMDIALMTSNASQLKYLLIHGAEDEHFVISVTLIGISITLQIIVGVLLILLGRWNLNYMKEQRKSDFLNNVIIVFVFLITVVNVLISAFGSGTPREGSDNQWRVGLTYSKNRYDTDGFDKSSNRFERSVPFESNCSTLAPEVTTDLFFNL